MDRKYAIDRVHKRILYLDQEFKHHGVEGQRWGIITRNVGVNYIPVGRRTGGSASSSKVLKGSPEEVYSKCHPFDFRKRTDPKELARMKKAADIGLAAMDKTIGIGFSCSKFSDGSYDGPSRDWFLFEDQTIGLPMFADLIAQGYTADQVEEMIKTYSNYDKYYESEVTFNIMEGSMSLDFYKDYLKSCEEVYNSTYKNAKYSTAMPKKNFNGYSADDIQKYYDSIPKGDVEYGQKTKDYPTTIYRDMSPGRKGYIEMYKPLFDDKRATIAISVHPDVREKGVGTKLLEGAKSNMDKLGLERLEYYVKPSNTASVNLAKKCGFKIDEDYSNYMMYTMAYDKRR